MKIYVLVLAAIFISSIDKTLAQDIQIINLEIDSKSSYNDNLDFTLNFDIVNNSEKDITIPDPSVVLNSGEVPFPSAFTIKAENVECDNSFSELAYIGAENFISIPKGTTHSFSIHPQRYEDIYCKSNGKPVSLQLVMNIEKDLLQSANGQYFLGDEKDDPKVIQIFESLPIVKVVSEKISVQ